MTHNCWSACFLVTTWNLGHDQVFSLITAILVTTISSSYLVTISFLSLSSSLQFLYFWLRPDCSTLFWNICRDLNLMSRHQFMFPIMLIFVATMFFIPFNKFYVTTSIPCRDLAVLFSTAFYVATSKACRDLISIVNH